MTNPTPQEIERSWKRLEAMLDEPTQRQFKLEQRDDCLYVVINGSATGPCFSLCDEREAKRYANVLNKANRYPLLD